MRLALALLALALLVAPCEVWASEFKISHQWPSQSDARDRAARVFIHEVESRISTVTFRIYPELSLKLKANEQFEALQSGKLEMSVYPLPYAVKIVPEFSLAVLPGLYPSLDAARSLRGSKVIDQLQTVANAHGVHILAWWWAPGGFASTSREIAGPNTVKGLRLRGGDPLYDLLLQKAGAIPVQLPSNEIYSAMASGKLDGALTSYETFVSEKIYEHAKYFTAGSPGIWMLLNPLLISKSVWDKLTDTEKQAFEAAALVSEDYFATTQQEAEQRFIEVFTRAGAKYHNFTNEDYMAWLQVAQDTAWAKYLSISPTAESMLYDAIRTILSSDKQ